MIYEQQGLWGETDLEFAERTAIELIKTFEPVALQRCPEHGYIVGYSGGKDSDCLVDLFIRSGVKFTVIHNHTTLDIPDTVRYVRKRFAEWTAQGIPCEISTLPSTTSKSTRFTKSTDLTVADVLCVLWRAIKNAAEKRRCFQTTSKRSSGFATR